MILAPRHAPPWSILGGNLVASLVMLGILFRDHRFSLRAANLGE
jgi:CBS-domain-containing membrane protein